jgi:hypothetical protein
MWVGGGRFLDMDDCLFVCAFVWAGWACVCARVCGCRCVHVCWDH